MFSRQQISAPATLSRCASGDVIRRFSGVDLGVFNEISGKAGRSEGPRSWGKTRESPSDNEAVKLKLRFLSSDRRS